MKTEKISTFLKDNKKTLLIVAALIVAAYLAWVGYKAVKRMISNIKNKSDAETLTGTEVTSGLQFGDIAAQIAMACRHLWGFRTDETAIYGALEQLRTQADWEYLKTYWSTYVYSNLSNFQSSMAWAFRNISQSLTGTLSSELGKSELQHCREILISKGITPDF